MERIIPLRQAIRRFGSSILDSRLTAKEERRAMKSQNSSPLAFDPLKVIRDNTGSRTALEIDYSIGAADTYSNGFAMSTGFLSKKTPDFKGDICIKRI